MRREALPAKQAQPGVERQGGWGRRPPLEPCDQPSRPWQPKALSPPVIHTSAEVGTACRALFSTWR